MLEELKDVYFDWLENMRKVLMSIDTRNYQPISQALYSVPLGSRCRIIVDIRLLRNAVL